MPGYYPIDTPPGTAPLPLGNGVASKGAAPPPRSGKKPLRGKRKPTKRPIRSERR